MSDNMKFEVSAVDNATSVLKNVQKAVDDTSEKIKSSWERIKDRWKKNEETFKDMRNYGAIAFGAISLLVWKSISDYSDAQKSANALEHAVVWVTHATQAQLKATSDLADALEKKWVLDWDNIKMGLAQLSTFWLSNQAVQKLWWSLADLAVNQFWAKATGEQLSDTANMIAKALNGQFWVLEKSWIRFTEAQKKMIEYGTEMQKVDAINQGFAQNLKYTNDVALQGLDGQMAKVQVQMGNLSESLGQALAPVLLSLMQAITPIIQKFTDWAQRNPELVKWIVLIAGGIAWLISVVGVLWMALPAIVTWISAVWTAITFMTWPIGLLITAIWLLTVFIYKNWDEIKAYFSAFSERFMSRWQPFRDGVKLVFTAIWDGIKLYIQIQINIIKAIFEVFTLLFTWHFKEAWEKVKSIFKNAWEWIKNIFWDMWNQALERGKNLINMFIQGIEAMIGKLVAKVKSVASTVSSFLWFHSPTEEWPWSDADTRAPNFMKMFSQGLVDGTSLVKNAVSWIPDTVKTAITWWVPMNSNVGSVARSGWGGWIVNITISNLYWTDKETAIKFANDMVWQFKRQFSFESF